jgi:galactitol-specific phosphotransferase system IIB component
MHSRKQLATVIEQVLTSEQEQVSEVDSSTIDEYKKLNEKCDTIITKIKTRKGKKTRNQQSEE